MRKNYNCQKGEILTIDEKHKLSQVHVECISHITCDDYITTITQANNVKITCSRSLSSFEKELFDLGFFRTSRNTIINLAKMEVYEKKPKPVIIMETKEKIQISRRRLSEFNKSIKPRT